MVNTETLILAGIAFVAAAVITAYNKYKCMKNGESQKKDKSM